MCKWKKKEGEKKMCEWKKKGKKKMCERKKIWCAQNVYYIFYNVHKMCTIFLQCAQNVHNLVLLCTKCAKIKNFMCKMCTFLWRHMCTKNFQCAHVHIVHMDFTHCHRSWKLWRFHSRGWYWSGRSHFTTLMAHILRSVTMQSSKIQSWMGLQHEP